MLNLLVFVLALPVGSVLSLAPTSPTTSRYQSANPSTVITNQPAPSCPPDAPCAYTVYEKEFHILGTSFTTTTLTVISTLTRPVTVWTTEIVTTTLPGKGCTVTSFSTESGYVTSTVESKMTNYVWVNSTVYATATVMETVYHLCAPRTISPIPTPPNGGLGQIPIVTIPVPLPNAAVTPFVTILEYEADYAKDKTAVVLTSSTTLPLSFSRTDTVEANPTPGRAMKMSCARDRKLTYHFLHGYNWDNVDRTERPDQNEINFGPISFNAKDWKFIDNKPNIVEQGNHPVLEAISGTGQFRSIEGTYKLYDFTIELPTNSALDNVPLEFSLLFLASSGKSSTLTYNLQGGSYGQRTSPSWDFANLGLETDPMVGELWPGLMSLKRTDSGDYVPFHLRLVTFCQS